MWGDTATQWLVGILYVAILYVLVRPGSNGSQFVQTLGSTMSDLVRGVTGQVFDQSSGTWKDTLS
jgi:hypothetical protein